MKNTTSVVSFVKAGKIVEVDLGGNSPWNPNTTLLNYLRSLPDSRGTKEGCAEGDCGACSVVIADEGPGGKLEYKAYDSCLIFLPMIQGKQLITVEDLGSYDQLHPVQEAMVNTGGSQCGYCTPGFIMSLFSLYKREDKPSRAQIDDALTGNLCRCTGYKPIVEAAAQACVNQGKDQFSAGEAEVIELLKSIQEQNAPLAIETDRFRYFRPLTRIDALRLRKQYPEAILVNGATDIGLLVTKQKQHLPLILDLSGVADMKFTLDAEGALLIGAGTSLETVKAASQELFPALYEMLAVFGSVQIRNLASLGGNIGTASPIGDTPPVLMALDASVEVHKTSGNPDDHTEMGRTLKMTDFVTGYRETQLAPDELITKVSIPHTPAGVQVNAYKISKRKDLDISTVSAGFRLELNPDNTVKEILLAYGGMAAMTKRAAKAEAFLTGKSWSRDHVEAAMDLVEAEFIPISDARSSKEGRRVMSRNLLLKFWVDTTQNQPVTV